MTKLLTRLLPASLVAFAMFQVHATSAAQFNVPAQVCQYMNVNQAKKLEYRSEGVRNTNTVEQWVVCPIATESFGGDVDTIARVFNPTDAAANVQCLFKLTDEFGNTRRNINLNQVTPPNATAILSTSNLDFDNQWTLTVSCKLPPGFLMVSLTVET